MRLWLEKTEKKKKKTEEKKETPKQQNTQPTNSLHLPDIPFSGERKGLITPGTVDSL